MSRLAGLRGRSLAAALAAGAVLAACAAPIRPNFVIIIGDDLGRGDAGAYGNGHILTPNIDRLAKAGMRFDRAFLTCSSCSPSRCSILTGRYPHATGAAELHHPLPPDQITFVDELRAGGYYTASIGKWHLGSDAPRRFDRVLRDNVGSGSEHWIEALRERPKNKPFFFWLASNDPHRPFESVEGYPSYDLSRMVVPPFLPDVAETRGELALYYRRISRLDDYVGRVLAELETQKVADRTVVLFLSDNGAPFPRAKVTVYDSGIATPFLVRYPRMVRPGSVSLGLVSAVDIAPTILELAGRTAPATIQGKSFARLLTHPEASVRDWIAAEHNWHDFPARERAIRTTRYKYILNSYPDLPATPPLDEVRSETFQAMRRLRDQGRLPAAQMGCFVKPRPAEELYDVEADPFELQNLAADQAHARTLQEMRAILARWQRETDDRAPPGRPPELFDRDTGLPLPGVTLPH